MPDIDNAIAAKVNPPAPFDALKALGTLTEIDVNKARAGLLGSQAQQEAMKLQGLEVLKRGGSAEEALRAGLPAEQASTIQEMRQKQDVRGRFGGLDPIDIVHAETAKNLAQEVAAKKADNLGRLGNVLKNGGSLADAVQTAKSLGMDVPPLVLENFSKMNPEQLKQAGTNLSAIGQTASQRAVTSGEQAGNEAREKAPWSTVQREPGHDLFTQSQITGAAGGAGALTAPPAANWPGAPAPTAPTPAPTNPALNVTPPGAVKPAIPGRTPEQMAEDRKTGEINATHLEEAKGVYSAATNGQRGLYDIQTSLQKFGEDNEGLLTPGPGASKRVGLAKLINTTIKAFGGDAPFPEDKIAAAEAAVKGTTRLGFETSRLLGSREAAQIVQQSIGIQPGVDMTKLGSAKVIFSLNAALQRDRDYFAFLQQWKDSKGTASGADIAFNQVHPPQEYVTDANKLYDIYTHFDPKTGVDGRKEIAYVRANPDKPIAPGSSVTVAEKFGSVHGSPELARYLIGRESKLFQTQSPGPGAR